MTEQRNAPILPVLVIGTLLGGAAGYFAAGLNAESSTPPAGEPATAARLEQLMDDVAALKQAATSKSARPSAVNGPAVVPASHAIGREPLLDETEVAAMDSRIAELERVVGSWQSERTATATAEREADAERQAHRAERKLRQQQDAAQAAQFILDGTKSDAQKLDSWQHLRRQENAYTDAIVQEMIRIGTSATDPAQRADVWRQADGESKHPSLAIALMRALQTDQEAKVREEAAETLEIYRDVPGVDDVLRAARDGDADEGVRRQAGNSLSSGKR